MRQSTVIFGTLLLGFVIYVTIRGQLPAYMSIFTGAQVGAGSAAAPTDEGSAAPSNPYSLDNLISGLGLNGKGFF